MSLKVCITGTIRQRENAGGSAWLYLTWALGLRALGCDTIWLEAVDPNLSDQQLQEYLSTVKSQLRFYELSDSVGLCSWNGEQLQWDGKGWYMNMDDAATHSDLLLNVGYFPHPLIAQFRRSVFVDSDPGLTQIWLSSGQLRIPRHTAYFTIGETLGTSQALFPDCGLRWHYTPLPVFLPAWPVNQAKPSAPFTTVSNWWGDYIEYEGQYLSNAKRASFLDYLDLPGRTTVPLELALTLTPAASDQEEREVLEQKGWSVRSLWGVSWTPEDYRSYVRQSRGEFSCAKPFYSRLRTAVIHDRTLHYLAGGKPAIVEHTGPSQFLPDAEGLFRFRNIEEASHALNTVQSDYERHCRLARELAEEYFDAKKIVARILEQVLA
jgi:hypothetical protein